MKIAYVGMDKFGCIIVYGVVKISGAGSEKEKIQMIKKQLNKKEVVTIEILLESK